MTDQMSQVNRILEHLAELLDIPTSHYEKAKDRYDSLGDWLHRPDSKVLSFDPEVYPQGSFRYGTVSRPLLRGEEYDLDLVCQLAMSKAHVSQAMLKALVGDEIRAYATAHSMNEPAHEKNRCWRIEYADDVSFHMDILPAIPDDEAFKLELARLGVLLKFAQRAVAITDRRHPGFQRVQADWPRSNPRGFAEWFEERMKPVARARQERLVEASLYASVDDVPTYQWKTPLQRSIQILKRHRDVMFNDTPDLKPISIIITTLSARAYEGELNLFDAITRILDKMPDYVNDEIPRVPNPVDPAEDFAEKWAKDSRLEKNFWAWRAQAQSDIAQITRAKDLDVLDLHLRARFDLIAEESLLRDLVGRVAAASVSVLKSAPAVIKSAPKPWGTDA